MDETLETLFVIIYNLVIIVGTVYLIQAYSWSAWWMLLAFCMLAGTKRKITCTCQKEEPKSRIIVDD